MKTKILKIKGLFPACLLMLFATASCISDYIGDTPGISSGNDKDVTFSLTLPGSSSGAKTYAMTDANENAVESIEVLLFVNDKYVETRTVAFADITHNNATGAKTFTVKIPEGTYSSMVILANSYSIVTGVGLQKSETKAVTLAKLVTSATGISGKWNAVSGTFRHIPMWGELSNITVDKDTPATTQTTPASVNLTRMLAKVSVKMFAAAKADFDLKEIYVYNYYDKGAVAPKDGYVGATIPGDATKPTGITPPLPPPYTKLEYSGGEVTLDGSAGEIYLFESDNSLFGDLDQDLLKRTCLVLGGQYKGVDSYYRADFVIDGSDPDAFMDVLRNHHYTFNIEKIKGQGEGTPDDAFTARPFNIEAKVIEWSDAEIKNVATDGQYMLGVSQMVYDLAKNAYTTGDTDNKLAIITDHRGGWKISTNETWIDFSKRSGDKSATPETIYLIVDENTTGVARTGTLAVTAGNITIYITVNQSKEPDLPAGTIQGEANSYIVAPGSAGILIPIGRCNQATLLGTQLNADDEFDAELVWTDNGLGLADNSNIKEVKPAGKGPSGYIFVVPGSGTGNAVVALKKSGKILWSWHIWVTDYVPNSSANGGFMDRNLGAMDNAAGAAKSLGLLYQWGRKDPFPGASAVMSTSEVPIFGPLGGLTIARVSVQGLTGISGAPFNIPNAFENPTTFYFNSTSPYDWYSSSATQDDYLWRSSEKTIYDPCPPGWRVPPYSGTASPWADLSIGNFIWNESNRGRTHSSYGGFYPAAGMRSSAGSGYGQLNSVGVGGYYWAAAINSANNVNGGCLYFNSSQVRPGDSHGRSDGLPVRCVAE